MIKETFLALTMVYFVGIVFCYIFHLKQKRSRYWCLFPFLLNMQYKGFNDIWYYSEKTCKGQGN